MSLAKKKGKKLNFKLLAIIIPAIATLIAAIIGLTPFFTELLENKNAFIVRISDIEGTPVDKAKISLFCAATVVHRYSDSEGVVTFSQESKKKSNCRLVVETENYEIYEQEIFLPRKELLEIRLRENPADKSTIIIHVVDHTNDLQVKEARVLLLVAGETYDEVTDSNGIVKFSVPIAAGVVDSKLRVETDSYEIDYQDVTLLSNEVQEIRLDLIRHVIDTESMQVKGVTANLVVDYASVSALAEIGEDKDFKTHELDVDNRQLSAETELQMISNHVISRAYLNNVPLVGTSSIQGSVCVYSRAETDLPNSSTGLGSGVVTGRFKVENSDLIRASLIYNSGCDSRSEHCVGSYSLDDASLTLTKSDNSTTLSFSECQDGCGLKEEIKTAAIPTSNGEYWDFTVQLGGSTTGNGVLNGCLEFEIAAEF